MHLGPCFQGLLVQEEFPVPLAVHALAIDGDVGVLGEEAVKGLLEFLARSGFVQCSDVLLDPLVEAGDSYFCHGEVKFVEWW